MRLRVRNTLRRPSGPGMVFALLGLVALASVLAVAGFMTVAIRNARLATQQRLGELYRGHLGSVGETLDRFWKERSRELEACARLGGPAAFAEIVRSGLADSALLFQPDGKLAYPNTPSPQTNAPSSQPQDWSEAEALEFQRRQATQAADVYSRIADQTLSAQWRARALLAKARCEVKAGQVDAAIGTWSTLTRDSALAHTLDEQGNLIIPSVQLQILATFGTNSLSTPALSSLQDSLDDYHDSPMSAEQRRFLMERTVELAAVSFPTLRAERLVADYLSLSTPVPTEQGFHAAARPGLWAYGFADSRGVALYRSETLLRSFRPLLDELALPGTHIEIHPPGDYQAPAGPLPALPAGGLMPGWRLTLGFSGVDPFAEAYRKEQRIYVVSGVLAVSLIGLFAVAIARLLQARLKLVQMQENLVSNVTHELRTPVSSIQALAESLQTHRDLPPEKTERYLDLLSRESTRLGEVIDHFLDFSRMEHGVQPLPLEPVSLAEVVDSCVKRAKHRFAGPGTHLEVDFEPGLPSIPGNREALQTMVLNLLDNAWNYTGELKQVLVRVSRQSDRLHLAVEDNGIGLTPKQAQHVFDRFYQADSGPTRSRGGCGLGLSIVRWIVEAHGGTVTVQSEPGKGSIFVASFPVDEAAAQRMTNQTSS